VQSLPNSLLPYFQPDQVLEDAGLTTPAPFLRSLILNGSAAWGISHTRVPTESRPGHVALLAGMYEDPSAVLKGEALASVQARGDSFALKGWKVNPIQFDSVLSASPHAYAMGSPVRLSSSQVLQLRWCRTLCRYSRARKTTTSTLGSTPLRWRTLRRVSFPCHCCLPVSTFKDAVELDVWVLDKFAALLANTSEAATLRQPGTMIFLHLLGLDTTGHAYRPQSMEYFRNIQAVDALLKRVVQLVQEFFEDDRTAFIFTADHGMSCVSSVAASCS
jgi:phosphatidylinositol glycan class N